MALQIAVDRFAITEFCRRHHIRRLALFGSVLRDDFGPTSDVDVLVEFERAHVPGFIRLGTIEAELGQLLGGRRTDLVTPKALSSHISHRVLTEAEPLYVEG